MRRSSSVTSSTNTINYMNAATFSHIKRPCLEIDRTPSSSPSPPKRTSSLPTFMYTNRNEKITHQNASIRQQFWVDDKYSTRCFNCVFKFNLIFRKHHCRLCGQVFCSDCLSRDSHGVKCCTACLTQESTWTESSIVASLNKACLNSFTAAQFPFCGVESFMNPEERSWRKKKGHRLKNRHNEDGEASRSDSAQLEVSGKNQKQAMESGCLSEPTSMSVQQEEADERVNNFLMRSSSSSQNAFQSIENVSQLCKEVDLSSVLSTSTSLSKEEERGSEMGISVSSSNSCMGLKSKTMMIIAQDSENRNQDRNCERDFGIEDTDINPLTPTSHFLCKKVGSKVMMYGKVKFTDGVRKNQREKSTSLISSTMMTTKDKRVEGKMDGGNNKFMKIVLGVYDYPSYSNVGNNNKNINIINSTILILRQEAKKNFLGRRKSVIVPPLTITYRPTSVCSFNDKALIILLQTLLGVTNVRTAQEYILNIANGRASAAHLASLQLLHENFESCKPNNNNYCNGNDTDYDNDYHYILNRENLHKLFERLFHGYSGNARMRLLFFLNSFICFVTPSRLSWMGGELWRYLLTNFCCSQKTSRDSYLCPQQILLSSSPQQQLVSGANVFLDVWCMRCTTHLKCMVSANLRLLSYQRQVVEMALLKRNNKIKKGNTINKQRGGKQIEDINHSSLVVGTTLENEGYGSLGNSRRQLLLFSLQKHEENQWINIICDIAWKVVKYIQFFSPIYLQSIGYLGSGLLDKDIIENNNNCYSTNNGHWCSSKAQSDESIPQCSYPQGGKDTSEWGSRMLKYIFKKGKSRSGGSDSKPYQRGEDINPGSRLFLALDGWLRKGGAVYYGCAETGKQQKGNGAQGSCGFNDRPLLPPLLSIISVLRYCNILALEGGTNKEYTFCIDSSSVGTQGDFSLETSSSRSVTSVIPLQKGGCGGGCQVPPCSLLEIPHNDYSCTQIIPGVAFVHDVIVLPRDDSENSELSASTIDLQKGWTSSTAAEMPFFFSRNKTKRKTKKDESLIYSERMQAQLPSLSCLIKVLLIGGHLGNPPSPSIVGSSTISITTNNNNKNTKHSSFLSGKVSSTPGGDRSLSEYIHNYPEWYSKLFNRTIKAWRPDVIVVEGNMHHFYQSLCSQNGIRYILTNVGRRTLISLEKALLGATIVDNIERVSIATVLVEGAGGDSSKGVSDPFWNPCGECYKFDRVWVSTEVCANDGSTSVNGTRGESDISMGRESCDQSKEYPSSLLQPKNDSLNRSNGAKSSVPLVIFSRTAFPLYFTVLLRGGTKGQLATFKSALYGALMMAWHLCMLMQLCADVGCIVVSAHKNANKMDCISERKKRIEDESNDNDVEKIISKGNSVGVNVFNVQNAKCNSECLSLSNSVSSGASSHLIVSKVVQNIVADLKEDKKPYDEDDISNLSYTPSLGISVSPRKSKISLFNKSCNHCLLHHHDRITFPLSTKQQRRRSQLSNTLTVTVVYLESTYPLSYASPVNKYKRDPIANTMSMMLSPEGKGGRVNNNNRGECASPFTLNAPLSNIEMPSSDGVPLFSYMCTPNSGTLNSEMTQQKISFLKNKFGDSLPPPSISACTNSFSYGNNALQLGNQNNTTMTNNVLFTVPYTNFFPRHSPHHFLNISPTISAGFILSSRKDAKFSERSYAFYRSFSCPHPLYNSSDDRSPHPSIVFGDETLLEYLQRCVRSKSRSVEAAGTRNYDFQELILLNHRSVEVTCVHERVEGEEVGIVCKAMAKGMERRYDGQLRKSAGCELQQRNEDMQNRDCNNIIVDSKFYINKINEEKVTENLQVPVDDEQLDLSILSAVMAGTPLVYRNTKFKNCNYHELKNIYEDEYINHNVGGEKDIILEEDLDGNYTLLSMHAQAISFGALMEILLCCNNINSNNELGNEARQFDYEEKEEKLSVHQYAFDNDYCHTRQPQREHEQSLPFFVWFNQGTTGQNADDDKESVVACLNFTIYTVLPSDVQGDSSPRNLGPNGNRLALVPKVVSAETTRINVFTPAVSGVFPLCSTSASVGLGSLLSTSLNAIPVKVADAVVSLLSQGNPSVLWVLSSSFQENDSGDSWRLGLPMAARVPPSSFCELEDTTDIHVNDTPLKQDEGEVKVRSKIIPQDRRQQHQQLSPSEIILAQKTVTDVKRRLAAQVYGLAFKKSTITIRAKKLRVNAILGPKMVVNEGQFVGAGKKKEKLWRKTTTSPMFHQQIGMGGREEKDIHKKENLIEEGKAYSYPRENLRYSYSIQEEQKAKSSMRRKYLNRTHYLYYIQEAHEIAQQLEAIISAMKAFDHEEFYLLYHLVDNETSSLQTKNGCGGCTSIPFRVGCCPVVGGAFLIPFFAFDAGRGGWVFFDDRLEDLKYNNSKQNFATNKEDEEMIRGGDDSSLPAVQRREASAAVAFLLITSNLLRDIMRTLVQAPPEQISDDNFFSHLFDFYDGTTTRSYPFCFAPTPLDTLDIFRRLVILPTIQELVHCGYNRALGSVIQSVIASSNLFSEVHHLQEEAWLWERLAAAWHGLKGEAGGGGTRDYEEEKFSLSISNILEKLGNNEKLMEELSKLCFLPALIFKRKLLEITERHAERPYERVLNVTSQNSTIQDGTLATTTKNISCTIKNSQTMMVPRRSSFPLLTNSDSLVKVSGVTAVATSVSLVVPSFKKTAIVFKAPPSISTFSSKNLTFVGDPEVVISKTSNKGVIVGSSSSSTPPSTTAVFQKLFEDFVAPLAFSFSPSHANDNDIFSNAPSVAGLGKNTTVLGESDSSHTKHTFSFSSYHNASSYFNVNSPAWGYSNQHGRFVYLNEPTSLIKSAIEVMEIPSFLSFAKTQSLSKDKNILGLKRTPISVTTAASKTYAFLDKERKNEDQIHFDKNISACTDSVFSNNKMMRYDDAVSILLGQSSHNAGPPSYRFSDIYSVLDFTTATDLSRGITTAAQSALTHVQEQIIHVIKELRMTLSLFNNIGTQRASKKEENENRNGEDIIKVSDGDRKDQYKYGRCANNNNNNNNNAKDENNTALEENKDELFIQEKNVNGAITSLSEKVKVNVKKNNTDEKQLKQHDDKRTTIVEGIEEHIGKILREVFRDTIQPFDLINSKAQQRLQQTGMLTALNNNAGINYLLAGIGENTNLYSLEYYSSLDDDSRKVCESHDGLKFFLRSTAFSKHTAITNVSTSKGNLDLEFGEKKKKLLSTLPFYCPSIDQHTIALFPFSTAKKCVTIDIFFPLQFKALRCLFNSSGARLSRRGLNFFESSKCPYCHFNKNDNYDIINCTFTDQSQHQDYHDKILNDDWLDEQKVLLSLSRCHEFIPISGKSAQRYGRKFYLTGDERFILKEISEVEMKLFCSSDFSQKYFAHFGQMYKERKDMERKIIKKNEKKKTALIHKKLIESEKGENEAYNENNEKIKCVCCHSPHFNLSDNDDNINPTEDDSDITYFELTTAITKIFGIYAMSTSEVVSLSSSIPLFYLPDNATMISSLSDEQISANTSILASLSLGCSPSTDGSVSVLVDGNNRSSKNFPFLASTGVAAETGFTGHENVVDGAAVQKQQHRLQSQIVKGKSSSVMYFILVENVFCDENLLFGNINHGSNFAISHPQTSNLTQHCTVTVKNPEIIEPKIAGITSSSSVKSASCVPHHSSFASLYSFEQLYDLKGCQANRLFSEDYYSKHCLYQPLMLLDENLMNRCRAGQFLFITNQDKELLSRVITRDTDLLASLKVIDYSLVVGIEKPIARRRGVRNVVAPSRIQGRANLWDESDCNGFSSMTFNKPRLRLGIIDYLHPYNFSKLIESRFKTITRSMATSTPIEVTTVSNEEEQRGPIVGFRAAPDHSRDFANERKDSAKCEQQHVEDVERWRGGSTRKVLDERSFDVAVVHAEKKREPGGSFGFTIYGGGWNNDDEIWGHEEWRKEIGWENNCTTSSNNNNKMFPDLTSCEGYNTMGDSLGGRPGGCSASFVWSYIDQDTGPSSIFSEYMRTAPTVIEPNEYKKRFCKAMNYYFCGVHQTAER